MHEGNMKKVQESIPQGCHECGGKAKDYCGIVESASGATGNQGDEQGQGHPNCEMVIAMLDSSKEARFLRLRLRKYSETNRILRRNLLR